MSQITENTVIIKPDAEARLLEDLNSVDYVSGIYKAFENKDMIIYNFDCNGDAPWEIENSSTMKLDYQNDLIALETNYLDGDSYWTRTPKGDIEEANLILWLKGKVTKAELKTIKKHTEYSLVGRSA